MVFLHGPPQHDFAFNHVGGQMAQERVKSKWGSRLILAFATVWAVNTQAGTTRYIVEFKEDSTQAKLLGQWGTQRQNTVLSKSLNQALAKALGQDTRVLGKLDQLGIVSIAEPSAATLESIAHHPSVKAIEKDFIIPLPENIRLSRAAPAVDLPDMPSAIIDGTPWGILAVKAPRAWANSVDGTGVLLAILDTGIDRDHPALKSNFIEGEDFVGDYNSPYPYFDTVGHGTHVAGTAAGARLAGGFAGVAPKAKIIMGRVCSMEGCGLFSILSGLSWVSSKKAQVLNMSLGGNVDSPIQKSAVNKAVRKGVIVVAAAGNDGTAQVGFPAAYDSVISVGAMDRQYKKASFSQYGPELDVVAPGVETHSAVPQGTGRISEGQASVGTSEFAPVLTAAFSGTELISHFASGELAPAGLGMPENMPTDGFGANQWALIDRGEISFPEKVANAIAAGAKGVVIVNNVAGISSGPATEGSDLVNIPVVMIEKTLGESFKAAIASGKKVQMKVKIAASDYSIFNGTSMASPHVAGVVALMKSVNPSLTPADALKIVKASATPLSPNDGNQFGSGLVNSERAVAQARSTR